MTSIFPLLYLLFCDEMCTRFRSLRTRWRTEVTKVLASTSRATCQALESERLAHAQLCDLVEEIRVAFGPRLTTYLLFVFLEHLARFYFDTYVMPTHRRKHSSMENLGVSQLESLMFLAHAWIGTYLVAYLSDALTESVMNDNDNVTGNRYPAPCARSVCNDARTRALTLKRLGGGRFGMEYSSRFAGDLKRGFHRDRGHRLFRSRLAP